MWKVIVKDGEVTLRGPVKSQDEKTEIESKATAIAGMGRVQNELSVKGEQ
jgi:hyperosmotically inducible periplasmic protein